MRQGQAAAWRKSRQRRLALGVSLAGHAMLGLAFLVSGGGSGDLIAEQNTGDVVAMTVSLVGSAEAMGVVQTEKPSQTDATSPAALLERLTQDSSTPPTPPHPDAPAARSTLEDLFQETARGNNGSVQGERQASETGTAAQAQAQAQAGSAAAAGRLWALVEPCWRSRSPARGTVVRLRVEIDALGRLRSPPQVVRTREMTLDDQQLVAESIALQALGACLSKARGGTLAGGHLLDFRAR